MVVTLEKFLVRCKPLDISGMIIELTEGRSFSSSNFLCRSFFLFFSPDTVSSNCFIRL